MFKLAISEILIVILCLSNVSDAEAAWTVGSNAGEARTLLIDLDFIKPGTYSVKLYKDAKSSNDITVEQLTVKTSDGLKVSMLPNGGFAVMFQSPLQ